VFISGKAQTPNNFIRGYEAVIGIEVHVQLKTKSKIFCSDSTTFDAADNENTSPVSVGMPGSLPVLNRDVVLMAIKTGLALGCKIREKSIFARKNYFYPDLPKGYQISQYDQPTCEQGELYFYVNDYKKTVSITRAHLEEDAGKSTHFGQYTLINYNRAGIPLLEIVSGPDLRSAAEAAEYAKTIRDIVKSLDVCDGNLEEGSLRCDCNVSVRKIGAEKFGTRVEIKNLNSFRFIEKAVDYEIERQIDSIESGTAINQETRLYDPDKNRTFMMRTKEDADDYRYFPDPDLLPILLKSEDIEKIRKSLPELPIQKSDRFQSILGLSKNDSEILTSDRALSEYFESCGKISGNYKSAANWVMGDLLRELNQNKVDIKNSLITPNQLAELIQLVDQNKISGKIAKAVFTEMWQTSKSAMIIVAEKGYSQVSDTAAIEKIIDVVIEKNQSQVIEYNSGKTKVFGFFVGAVMKESKGQANPDIVNDILKRKLEN
jgi:aspartyl-tRNA(Asn)/glutamyl-tRNA(Gln) amidotransferase subunit B